jgi:hypothetical protein
VAPPVRDVSVKDFAALIGRTTVRVYQLIGEGMPHRKRSKSTTRIVPKDAIGWMLERAREEAAPKDGTPKARERRDLAEAELKEIIVQERRRALVPLEEFEEFTDTLIGGLAAVSSGRLQRFERDIVTAVTPADARKLTERIHEALMAGAQEYAAELEAEAGEMEAASQAADEAA